MALQFGCGDLVVSGLPIARLMNLNFNITYDVASLRGGNRIFADNSQLYNGAIEGSFENGEVNASAISNMLGATVDAGGTSGTMTLTATQVLGSGRDIVCTCVTNGVTGILTFYNCKFNSIGITLDRENYTMPKTDFVCNGNSAGKMMTWQI